MSYVEDFDHYIPPDDWDGGYYRGKSKRNQYSSYPHYAKAIAKILNKPVKALIHTTDKAYLFEFEDGKCWFPISQVTYSENSKKIAIPEWLWLNRRYIKENA